MSEISTYSVRNQTKIKWKNGKRINRIGEKRKHFINR